MDTPDQPANLQTRCWGSQTIQMPRSPREPEAGTRREHLATPDGRSQIAHDAMAQVSERVVP